MKCRDCNTSRIRSRSNASHGNKSKKITSFECKECGSSNIEFPIRRGRRR